MLKILRRLFNISTCKPLQGQPCFYRQMHQCLGVCTGEITPAEYRRKVIQPLTLFLKGKKKTLIKNFIQLMRATAKAQNFEEASRLRDQIKHLQKIQDIALLNKEFFNFNKDNFLLSTFNFQLSRIEGYDISNLGDSGKVGSMVVFNTHGPIKSQYRKFKIKTVAGQSDIDCLEEVLTRRLNHPAWPLPDIFLVDGGKAQVNIVTTTLNSQSKILNLKSKIPVIGIAKGAGRKKNEFIFDKNNKKIADFIKNNQDLLIQVRDEAHRFAIQYQRKLRALIPSSSPSSISQTKQG